MHSSRAWRGTAAVAAIAATCGLAVTGTEAAMAVSSAGVGVTISAKSAFAPITGLTAVQLFGTARTDSAAISGTVTGIPAGMDAAVTLLSKPFGAKSFTAGRTAAVTVTAGTAHYSFSVAPNLATTYEARVTESAAPSPSPSPSTATPTPSPSSTSPSPTESTTTGTTPPAPPPISTSPSGSTSAAAPDAGQAAVVAATSKPVTVYVMGAGAILGAPACAKPVRPVCHVTLTFVFRVPLSTVKIESAKHLFTYLGLALSATGAPKRPTTLALNNATVSKVRKIAPREFEFVVHFAFKVGNDGFNFLITGCTQDTEARDGINLPGHHGCGNKVIPASITYLG